MRKFIWGPEENLIVPLTKAAFLMNDDDSARCQMHRVGIPEHSIIQWAKQFGNKDKRFIDCGAHMGTYSLLLADEFKEIEAFEAQRRTYFQTRNTIGRREHHPLPRDRQQREGRRRQSVEHHSGSHLGHKS
jgi:hypothetical protein